MAKGRRVQYFVTLAVSLSSLTIGVSSSWMTPVIPKLHDNSTGIIITTKEISWAAGIASIGYMSGSLLTRYTSDAFGRRSTILGSALPMILAAVIILNITTAWMLLVSRFLWGAGSGMLGTVCGIYIAEISDKEIRGTLSVMNRFMFNFGCSFVVAVGPFFSFRGLCCMLLVLPICYLVACWFIPETPYYYLKEGKVDAARKALTTLTGTGDETVLEDRLSVMRSDVRKEMLRSGSVKELFTGKQYRKAIIIVIGIKLSQILAGSLAIPQYFGRVVQETTSIISVSTALMVYGAVRFVVGIFSVVLIDKVGRRPLLIYTLLCSGVMLVIVGAYFFIGPSSSSYFSIIPFIGMLLNAIVTSIGYDPLGYIIPTEIFPINVKAVAMTFVNILGGFLGFFSIKGYQEMKDLAGLKGVFWFYGTAALAGAVFSLLVVPEMRGKSLREIQVELQGRHMEKNTLEEAGEQLNQVENENGISLQLTEVRKKDTSI